MPQSDASPRPSWASREGLVIPAGPGDSADVARNAAHLDSIVQTLHRCGLALDESNESALTDCVTHDVVLRATVAGEVSFRLHHGAAQALDWFRDLSLSTDENQQRLLITNAILDGRTDPVEHVTFVLVVLRTGRGVVAVSASGVARADLRLDRGAWRIGKLVVGLDSSVRSSAER